MNMTLIKSHSPLYIIHKLYISNLMREEKSSVDKRIEGWMDGSPTIKRRGIRKAGKQNYQSPKKARA
jgi:hypothetical protein